MLLKHLMRNVFMSQEIENNVNKVQIFGQQKLKAIGENCVK